MSIGIQSRAVCSHTLACGAGVPQLCKHDGQKSSTMVHAAAVVALTPSANPPLYLHSCCCAVPQAVASFLDSRTASPTTFKTKLSDMEASLATLDDALSDYDSKIANLQTPAVVPRLQAAAWAVAGSKDMLSSVQSKLTNLQSKLAAMPGSRY